MAKQKKKKSVHKNKPVLPRKDRTVYEIIMLIVFVGSVVALRCYERIFYLSAAVFGRGGGYYHDLNITFFSALLMLCPAACALISLYTFGELNDKGMTLKQFADKNNKKAKQFIKSITITFVPVLLVFCVSFGVAGASQTVATEQNITATYLMKKDEVLVDYNDVTAVRVFVEYERISGVKGMSHKRYTPAIELCTDSETFRLSASGFGFDYDKMCAYLKLFDSDIITVDDSDYALISRQTDAVKEMFHK